MTTTERAPAAEEARAFFHAMFASRSADELDMIARAKRFRERYTADRRFREALQAGEDAQALFDRHGVPARAEETLPLWHVETWEQVKATETLDDWPLAGAWKRWVDDLLAHRDMLKRTATIRPTAASLPGASARCCGPTASWARATSRLPIPSSPTSCPRAARSAAGSAASRPRASRVR